MPRLVSFVQGWQNSAPPDQGTNVQEIASLGFTSMSLDPCGKAIPVAVYTKDVLTTAGCLKWSASFKNYPSGLQNPGNVLEVTVLDPNNQEVSQGSSDSLSGDPQSGGSFAGTVSIPDTWDGAGRAPSSRNGRRACAAKWPGICSKGRARSTSRRLSERFRRIHQARAGPG
jgi:hypothetical protein